MTLIVDYGLLSERLIREVVFAVCPQAEAEREAKYFNELEKKEQVEDKMKTITEIKVRVVFCKQVKC